MSTSPNPFDSPQVFTERRMGGAAKLLLGLGAGCFTLCVVCCGGFVTIAYLTGNWTSRLTTDDPATVRDRTGEIADIKIPSALYPITSFRLSVGGKPSVTTVGYAEATTGSSLVLGQFDDKSARDMRRQLDDAMRHAALRREELIGEESEKIERTIRGQAVTFTLVKGKSVESEKTFWRGSATFPGKAGTALLVFQFREPPFGKQQAIELIESIH